MLLQIPPSWLVGSPSYPSIMLYSNLPIAVAFLRASCACDKKWKGQFYGDFENRRSATPRH